MTDTTPQYVVMRKDERLYLATWRPLGVALNGQDGRPEVVNACVFVKDRSKAHVVYTETKAREVTRGLQDIHIIRTN